MDACPLPNRTLSASEREDLFLVLAQGGTTQA